MTRLTSEVVTHYNLQDQAWELYPQPSDKTVLTLNVSSFCYLLAKRYIFKTSANTRITSTVAAQNNSRDILASIFQYQKIHEALSKQKVEFTNSFKFVNKWTLRLLGHYRRVEPKEETQQKSKKKSVEQTRLTWSKRPTRWLRLPSSSKASKESTVSFAIKL